MNLRLSPAASKQRHHDQNKALAAAFALGMAFMCVIIAICIVLFAH